ncbi:hypothetical protein GCM10007874_35680 [Labrys miyagiensis]|uniref:Transposase n=1 Tax=Labrys miyagiensis TaxID=346912 RepID=A0ABQ6CJW3_9HYPH|nr:hypothetical protein GCM10007874_35680 [Labrys miyagiensis]
MNWRRSPARAKNNKAGKTFPRKYEGGLKQRSASLYAAIQQLTLGIADRSVLWVKQNRTPA